MTMTIMNGCEVFVVSTSVFSISEVHFSYVIYSGVFWKVVSNLLVKQKISNNIVCKT